MSESDIRGSDDGDGGCRSSSSSEREHERRPPVEIEVEQKFALVSSDSVTLMEERLKHMGFERLGPVQRFTDSYVDVAGPPWCLTIQDHWFRYREYHHGNDDDDGVESPKGSWELKRRPPSSSSSTATSTTRQRQQTVFQEMEGNDAVEAVMSLISTFRKENPVLEPESKIMTNGISTRNLQYSSVLNECGMSSFASFETIRSSWGKNSRCDNNNRVGADHNDDMNTSEITFNDLRVDLDGTNFGHMVGEVEAIVSDEERVDEAMKCIEDLIDKLVGQNDKSTAVSGKLQTFMRDKCREHYDECVNAGCL